MGISYYTSRSNNDNSVLIYAIVHIAQMILNKQQPPLGQPFHSTGFHLFIHLWARNSQNWAECSLFIPQPDFWTCSGKTFQRPLDFQIQWDHSTPVLSDLSATSEALTAPACPPPQLSGLHSPSLSLTIGGLWWWMEQNRKRRPSCRPSSSTEPWKFTAAWSAVLSKIIHPEFSWLYLNLLTSGEMLNEG